MLILGADSTLTISAIRMVSRLLQCLYHLLFFDNLSVDKTHIIVEMHSKHVMEVALELAGKARMPIRYKCLYETEDLEDNIN